MGTFWWSARKHCHALLVVAIVKRAIERTESKRKNKEAGQSGFGNDYVPDAVCSGVGCGGGYAQNAESGF